MESTSPFWSEVMVQLIMLAAGLLIAGIVVLAIRRRSSVTHDLLAGTHAGLEREPAHTFEQLPAFGVAPPGLTAETRDEVLRLLTGGELLRAVVLYRESTGVSLADAKLALERGDLPTLALHDFAPRAAVPASEDAPMDRVRALAEKGQKIEAIKLYRELTGAGLAEAKDAVEQQAFGGVPKDRPDADAATLAELDAEISRLLSEGRGIDAIKLTRERLKLDLREAKAYVDRLA